MTARALPLPARAHLAGLGIGALGLAAAFLGCAVPAPHAAPTAPATLATPDGMERAACDGVPKSAPDWPVLAKVLEIREAADGAIAVVDVGRRWNGVALCLPARCLTGHGTAVRGVVVGLADERAEVWFPIAPGTLAGCTRAIIGREGRR